MAAKPHMSIYPVGNEPLVFEVPQRIDAMLAELPEGGRKALTLAKDGPLSVVLLVMDKANEVAEHAVAGPTTVQLLRGRATLKVSGSPVHMTEGMVVVFPPDASHSVRAHERSALLVTVASAGAVHPEEQ
ncbi:MAG: cupin domain-containing protein [Tepidiformaceae bacterium]